MNDLSSVPSVSGMGLPLPMAEEGIPLRVVNIVGGDRSRSRLSDLGITHGVVITVVQRGGPGPFLIGVHAGRIAIGAGIASRIIVMNEKD